jgi:hypothetical protein
VFILVPAQAYVAQFRTTFKDFPPRQKAASFSIDQVVEALQTGGAVLAEDRIRIELPIGVTWVYRRAGA